MLITAVTGFYDIGRARYDNRSADKYVSWLNQTLQTRLPFLVFLDPAFDASGVVLKPEDRIVRVARDDLTMFRHGERIREIVSTSQTVNRRDISFHVAEYGMIVMSKLEMMKRAASETDADYLIWIDAGHCRMIPDLGDGTIKLTAADLDGIKFGLYTTYHLSQRMRIGKFPRRMVGTTLAMMSAADFIVARDFAEELSDRMDFMVEQEWLPAGKWDNEQMAIGTLLFRGGLPGARVLRTHVGGGSNAVSWLFGAPLDGRKTPLYVRWRLLLDEFRTRLAPPEDCYLPGDFPEAAFQAWRQSRR
ncbi:WlaTC/HtrL family glycosyltransferase [Devosia beringensis]|uniref:WlaTC/HtrL family glycosyltransferase n=1 Tax=Devosia beringensis TaxID=2657486 RepID=UPI00186BA242|nr:WlaTC/HtrL family glycosyltransferase [Devosia beringensis]